MKGQCRGREHEGEHRDERTSDDELAEPAISPCKFLSPRMRDGQISGGKDVFIYTFILVLCKLAPRYEISPCQSSGSEFLPLHFQICSWPLYLRNFRWPLSGGRGISLSDAPLGGVLLVFGSGSTC